ncbi:DUF6950 family protein [Bradyrhizobium sp. SEMIA]|uniref:DUF6950 family protein n=1 Tax=Bradyrhizobium sp. SEMIA TaxID=2597515 RepID=UPI0018A341CF|nr:hypothetical protein [Bradyrhizobium sp. SEMIA]QOG20469.1 hypothetical protein FOM02_27050 [Bradyrhizobium sp. SEMIA]
MPALSDYLDEIAGRTCAYGALDCATLMADWLMRNGWPDAMSDRRGTYVSEREYRAALRSEGGMLASCRRRFASLGLRETADPVEGDPAVVLAPMHGRAFHVGAIARGAGLVALLSWPRGVVCAQLPIAAAWSLSRG